MPRCLGRQGSLANGEEGWQQRRARAPERRRPGGCAGRLSQADLEAREASHSASLSAIISISSASSAVGAHVPARV